MNDSENINFTPIQKETVPEKIIRQIKSMIESGQLKPGSRLPAERGLADMLNVGRPALREALKALSYYPAQIFGVDEDLGSLEVGKVADLVLFEGDPIRDLSPVSMVVIAGELVTDN